MKQSPSPLVLSVGNTPHVSSMVSKPVSVAWEPFARNLEAVLAQLDEDQFLVLSLKNHKMFVQFVGQGSWGLRAETVSNYYRAKDNKLSKSQMAWLIAQGWNAPSSRSSPQLDPDGSSNFFLDQSPADFAAIANLTVATFIEVGGASHPGLLEYEGYDGGGNSLVFLELGLRQHIDSDQVEQSVQEKRLLDCVKGHTGLSDLFYDEGGEIGISYQNLSAFISLVDERPYARICSTVLANAVPDLALLLRLNDLNSENGHLHLVCKGGSVVAISDLLITPMNTSHIAHWISNFCQITEQFQTVLCTEFGGESVSPTALH